MQNPVEPMQIHLKFLVNYNNYLLEHVALDHQGIAHDVVLLVDHDFQIVVTDCLLLPAVLGVGVGKGAVQADHREIHDEVNRDKVDRQEVGRVSKIHSSHYHR